MKPWGPHTWLLVVWFFVDADWTMKVNHAVIKFSRFQSERVRLPLSAAIWHIIKTMSFTGKPETTTYSRSGILKQAPKNTSQSSWYRRIISANTWLWRLIKPSTPRRRLQNKREFQTIEGMLSKDKTVNLVSDMILFKHHLDFLSNFLIL